MNPNEFINTINTKLRDSWQGTTLSKEERQVLLIIWNHWEKGDHVTQAEIARTVSIGAHEKHEPDNRKRDSTLRQVRQQIRNLRILHGIPILSDRTGYWLPKTLAETQIYVEAMEKMAKAQAAAWFQTYVAVKDTLNITSSFFDKLE